MLKFLGFIINLFLIIGISLRIPQENIGLASFATKNKMLNSTNSMQRWLNIITIVGITFYIFIAVQLNFILK